MFWKRNKTRPKKRITRILIEILVFLLLMFAITTWMTRDMIKGIPPVISIADIQGQSVVFADYTGQPLLLHFWASWCKICDFERGVVDAVSKDWPVLSIAMTSGDNQKVTEFMQEKSIDWRTIADEDGTIANDYGVVAVPANFILNSRGEIVFTDTGYITSWGLRLRLWLARVMS